MWHAPCGTLHVARHALTFFEKTYFIVETLRAGGSYGGFHIFFSIDIVTTPHTLT
jgi:hypothetical protein